MSLARNMKGVGNIYKVRRISGTKEPRRAYVMGVPREFGDRLEGEAFEFTLVEEGILYRRLERAPTKPLPMWLEYEQDGHR